MPAPTNPPHSAGAHVQPRQLNRWLDINKINKLTRAQTYFSIPVFSVDVRWLGYSELVAVFNYTATNNFSIKLNQTTLPIAPNYLACITWVDSSYNVHRYKLWESSEVMFFDIPLYTNQQIKHNFRIEIWTVKPASFSQITLVGAGLASANGDWTYDSGSGNWIQSSGINKLTGVGGYGTQIVWTIFDAGSFAVRYTLPDLVVNVPADIYAGLFPGGRWITSALGTDPAPFGYVDVTCSQATSVDLYTGVLQAYDYRYVSDAKLASDPTIVSTLSNVLPLVLPAVFPANSTPTLN